MVSDSSNESFSYPYGLFVIDKWLTGGSNFVASKANSTKNSVKIINNRKDAYAAFKPVPAVPEDHVYSAVDFMAAPTPAPPAVFSRAQEIIPIVEEDNDIIASVPEVSPMQGGEYQKRFWQSVSA